MITYGGWRVPDGFKSDGCTLAPDSWFGANLKPACILHDFQRRYGLLPIPDADAMLNRHLIALGAPAWLAFLYYLGCVLLRPFFKATMGLPYQWRDYAKPVGE